MPRKRAKKGTSYQVIGRERIETPRLIRRRAAGLAVIVVVAFGGLFLHLLSRPANGHVIQASDFKPLKHKPQAASVSPPSTVQSAYFQLPLPAGYQEQAASQTTAGLLYQQTILKPSASGSLVIAIALKALPDGGLNADSSYALRLQQSDHYHIASQTVSGDIVKVATDSQSSAIAAFWPHGGYLATVGISSGVSTPGNNDTSDELAALQPLLAAWRWR